MMYEFIFEDTTPPTHCKDPVLSGATGGKCGPRCISGGSAHHRCADKDTKYVHMYCECPRNRDYDETGVRQVRHYFKETSLGDGLICPSCRANCRY